MSNAQAGILAPLDPMARYVTFDLAPGADASKVIERLAAIERDERVVVGIGPSLVAACGVELDGWTAFPALTGKGIDIPATPSALWLWFRGDDRGELIHRSRKWIGELANELAVENVVDAFSYDGNRDLGGYEDGT